VECVERAIGRHAQPDEVLIEPGLEQLRTQHVRHDWVLAGERWQMALGEPDHAHRLEGEIRRGAYGADVDGRVAKATLRKPDPA
jgi:hypothetical protein